MQQTNQFEKCVMFVGGGGDCGVLSIVLMKKKSPSFLNLWDLYKYDPEKSSVFFLLLK